MDELVISGKKYISSKRASELTGYAKDYIGQLARGGKVPATRIGRAWYVDETALVLHASTGEVEEKVEESKVLLDTESNKVLIHKPLSFEKKIPSVSHALSQMGRSLPSTWAPISYYSDEAVLFPVTPKNIHGNNLLTLDTLKNKEISAIQEKNNLRVRILKAKTGTRPPKVLFDAPSITALEKTLTIKPEAPLKGKSSLRNTYGFFAYSLLATGSAVFILFVLGSGLLVSSHVTFTPPSGAYTANAYVSYQYAQDTIREIPGLQIGYDSLKGFFLFIKESPGNLFFKGADFLKHLINLV